MEHQDSRQEKEGRVDPKAPYEPPKATFVSVELEERLLACNFRGGTHKDGCAVARNG